MIGLADIPARAWAALGGLFLVLLLGACGAWNWQANAYEKQLIELDAGYDKTLAEKAEQHGKEREAAATAVIEQLQLQQDQRRALENRLQAQDQKHYMEMKNAQNDRARLRDRLATADLRLSVLLAGPLVAPGGDGGVRETTAAGSVVHDATRAELDPAHAQRIVGITGDGDDGLRALQACQDYVAGVLKYHR